ncbi:PAS domain S-box protein [Chitinophaga oryziterrae]|uniref:histidine kinase n=1 Tax=Chitinophaga oryziterrae TaxID=1031224 RepID=A0A6N8JCG1_9BACT|nr:PAS domain S-box protein [Chitinophaga oryziterrae]MVT41949.1 PAS domain S-box protein [Chitinophaga oryziterrae]
MEQHLDKGVRPGSLHKGDNEEWMRFALLSSGLGTWDLDIASNQVIWDDRCRELYGYVEEGEVSREVLIKYIHPEDRERVMAAIDHALNPESSGLYDVVFRIAGIADNQLRWLRNIGKAYFDNGVAYRVAGTMQDITADIKRKEKKQMLLSLVESCPEMMGAATLDNRFFYMNPSGRKLLGIPEEIDITTLSIEDLYRGEEFAKITGPIQSTDQKWSGTIYVNHYITKELIPCHANFVVIKDALDGHVLGRGATLRDLRPELHAAKEQQKLLSLLENSRDFVSLSDEEGNVTYVNAAGLKLLGLNSQEEARRHNSDYLMPEETGKLKEVINAQLFSKGVWSGEVLYRHFKTGEAIPVEGTTMLVYDPVTGNSQGRATIARDLREEKAAYQQRIENELELEKIVEIRTSELKKANIDLNIVNENLEQFAYVASHDLQEPLRKINMFSALLEDRFKDQLNETGMKNLGIIRNAATRMTTLIQDLLAFSRISRQDHLFEEVDLSATVQQVLGDFDMLIQQKDAVVECDGLFHVPGIPLHITQLFHNLLSNALKFTREGISPLIRITSRMMDAGEIAGHPQLQNGPRYGEIRISDNGIGFASTYTKKIFVIFQRLHGRGEYEGSGIGLALCQKIVTAHHGVIYADSEEGKGATFVVILPVYT